MKSRLTLATLAAVCLTATPALAQNTGDFPVEEKFAFEYKQQAADAIKRAARLYGASLVGITRRNNNVAVQFECPAGQFAKQPVAVPGQESLAGRE